MKNYDELEKWLRERAYAITAVSPVVDNETARNAKLFVEAANAIFDLTKRLAIAEARPAAEGSIRVRTHGSVLEGIAAQNLADDERALLSKKTVYTAESTE